MQNIRSSANNAFEFYLLISSQSTIKYRIQFAHS